MNVGALWGPIRTHEHPEHVLFKYTLFPQNPRCAFTFIGRDNRAAGLHFLDLKARPHTATER
ncbi:hypothetical protein CFREI_01115 [Corynebacterium freiburgense]|nr:hypothetical protein CFREI_01115 [Corynebacterium freiburgense]